MRDRSRRSYLLLLAGVFVAALLLRLGAMGQRELWLDECFSAVMTRVPEGIWTATHAADGIDGNNPPVYFWALKGWTSWFGITEAGVRSLSILAGLLQMVVLGAAAKALGFSRRGIVLVLSLAAVSFPHVYYSVEGRAYMLLLVFLTAAMAAYFRGIRTNRPGPWIVHGAAVAVAAYTHLIALPFAATFWLALPFLAARPRTWLRLGMAHLGAALLYLPWLPVLLASRGQGRAWIAGFYDDLPHALLAPRSLEVFGVGGKIPEYLKLFPAVHPVARGISIVFFAVVAIAAIAWGFRPGPPVGKDAQGPPRRVGAALLVFLACPLAFLYMYSRWREPLYLVGRYDITAYPAYLLLAGLGMDRLIALAPPRKQGIALGAVLLVLTGLGADAYRNAVFHPALQGRAESNTERGRILSTCLSPDDVIVCTGYTTPPTKYQLLRHGLDATVVTFPLSQMKHFGWFEAADVVRTEEATAREDARTIVGWIADSPPRYHVLWCMVSTHMDDRESYTRMVEWLLSEVRRRDCRLVIPEGEVARWQELGIYPMGPPGAPLIESR